MGYNLQSNTEMDSSIFPLQQALHSTEILGHSPAASFAQSLPGVAIDSRKSPNDKNTARNPANAAVIPVANGPNITRIAQEPPGWDAHCRQQKLIIVNPLRTVMTNRTLNLHLTIVVTRLVFS